MNMKYLGPTKHAVVTCLWCNKKFKSKFIRNAPTTHDGKCKILHRKRNAKLWSVKNKKKLKAYMARWHSIKRSSYVESKTCTGYEPNESLLIR